MRRPQRDQYGHMFTGLFFAVTGLSLIACKGPAGTNGVGCTVTDNNNGTKTIACGDGSTATVTNGQNGRDLQPKAVAGRVDVTDFGAVADGITDDTAAIRAALAYAGKVLTQNPDDSNTLTITCSGNVAVSDQVEVPALNRLNLEFDCTVKVIGWTRASTEPAFILRNRQSYVRIAKLDCGKLSAGIQTWGYDLTLDHTSIFNYQTYGLNQWQGGNCTFNGVTTEQWTQSDPEFADDAQWTAAGIQIDGIDSKYFDCNVAWSRVGIRFTPTASGNFIYGSHVWNGRPDALAHGWTKPNNPTIVESLTKSPNFMIGCYFDNGHVDLYEAGLKIEGGWYLNVPDNVTLDHPYIRYFNAGGDDAPYSARISNLGASVGFFPGAGGSYLGDYADINANDPGSLAGGRTDVFETQTVITPNVSSNMPAVTYYKPQGQIRFSYRVPGGTAQELRFDPAYDETQIRTSVLRAMSFSGATPHAFKLGGGETGIRENAPGVLSVYSGGDVGWNFGNGTTRDLVPVAPGVSNLGSATSSLAGAYVQTVRPGDGKPKWTSGSGSPEGVLTAVVGSLYTRTDGASSTTLYVKESGGGNTGWVAK